jgi:antitoxin VapB
MPLYIKDDHTVQLVARLAKLRGLSKQDAVKVAVQAEIDRAAKAVPLRDQFAALRLKHPLPPRVLDLEPAELLSRVRSGKAMDNSQASRNVSARIKIKLRAKPAD